MLVFGMLAALCLVAGFGLGLYENDVRWQIVEAVHAVRPDLEPYAMFSRARSFRNSEVHELYRANYAEHPLLKWHKAISFAAMVCFLAFAVFLLLAIKQS
ncbi:MAG: hypothetical protein WCC26_10230 [Terracidiphilus sp.]